MAGVGVFMRLILRRDRIKLPLWIAGFVGLLVAMAPLLKDLYSDPKSLEMLHTTFSVNPSVQFITGPMDTPTFGAFMTIETLIWWGVAIAFINTLLVVRHTRHNEEVGAQELLLSAPVHRASGLAAALAVAFGVNVLITLGVGFGLWSIGTEWGLQQIWTYASGFGIFGMVWAAIAAVVVQLVGNGRGANGVLAGLIGMSFIVRGVGDFLGKIDSVGLHQPHWISYVSPLGWLQASRPLTLPDFTPLAVLMGCSVAMVALAFILLSIRDVGAAVLPSRGGKRRASRFLATPLGLSVYLQKNIFIGWLVGVLMMVVTVGSLVPQMSSVFDQAEEMRRVIEVIGGPGALIPSYLSAMIAIVSVVVLAYALHGLGRMRSEESSGRLESILATKVSRTKWLALHTGLVFAGGASMLVLMGGSLGLLVNGLSEYQVDVGEYLLAGVSYLPAVIAFLGLYVLLFGLLPRVAGGLTWFYFGFSAFTLWLGPIMQLDQKIMNLSIMEHITAPPSEAIAVAPLATITTVGMGLIVVGFIAFRRRDSVG